MWCLWIHINKIVFNQEVPNPHMAMGYFKYFCNILESSQVEKRDEANMCIRQYPIPIPWHKTSPNLLQQQEQGMIFWDIKKGTIRNSYCVCAVIKSCTRGIHGFCKTWVAGNILQARALTLRETLFRAQNLEMNNIITSMEQMSGEESEEE